MREVRPTIRLLKTLPRETFGNPEPLDLIRRQVYGELSLYGVDHPLLEDARRRFANGLPDRHQAASRAAGRPVYEVRDRQGAAWRGAVVLDKYGDPWLVWAERHDRFHATVANVNFDETMPISQEYVIRDREESAAKATSWRCSVLTDFLNTLKNAVETGERQSTQIRGPSAGQNATVSISVEHDVPADKISEAHQRHSYCEVTLRIKEAGGGAFRDALLGTCLPFLETDQSQIDSRFGLKGELIAVIVVSQAKLVQLLADPSSTADAGVPAVSPPDHLHYVGVDYLIDGYVSAKPVRAVCGEWFIPSRGESADLPICEKCEQEAPAAELALKMIRASL